MAQFQAVLFSEASPSTPRPPFSPQPLPPFRISSLFPSSPPHALRGCKTSRARRRRFGLQVVAGSDNVDSAQPELGGSLKDIYKCCSIWKWKSYNIHFFVKGAGPPLLLVHGFGASIAHWRRNLSVLSENYTVYAIDLLGFGNSDKPLDFSYTMEVWSQLIIDFLSEIIKKPTVLIGNSVGSLACVIAASEATGGVVRAITLLNCAGGMNNKAIVDDWRIRLLMPILLLFDLLLKQRWIAYALFENVKKRENLSKILLSVYGNKESVDDELIEIIKRPADEIGALDAFVSIISGPPGPNPVSLMPKVTVPVLVLWGNHDPFTPIDGPVGKYFSSLPSQLPNVSLYMLEGVGHCPHDDRPDLVHEKLLPWLASLPSIA